MPTIEQLGSFTLTSPKVVVTDPGYDTDTASIGSLGCFISECATGTWCAVVIKDISPHYAWAMPRTFMAVCDGFTPPESEGWQRARDSVGGDSALIGIFDLAHFHDTSSVPSGQKWTFDGQPAIPDDLWYSYICEMLREKQAAVICHGAVVHWDGGMDVDTYSHGGKVVAIRLSICGWPDNV